MHLHIVLAAGGWSVDDPRRLVTTGDRDWMDKQALMCAFRRALLDELEAARAGGALVFRGDAAHLADDRQFTRWIGRLRRRRWFVIVKVPAASAAKTLDYLAHYMNKVAIGNRRIKQIDLVRETVTFTYRNNRATEHDWGAIETKTLDALQFIGRVLLHALPARMSRCRAYGFWASRAKGKDLPEIRRQLGEPPRLVDADDGAGQEEQERQEADDELMRRLCKRCGERSMEVIAQVPKPTVYEMMQLKIWPELFSDDSGDDLAQAEDPQQLLPGVADYVPGGDLYLEALGFL